MLKPLKIWIKKFLTSIFKSEMQGIKNEMHNEFKNIYFELRWKEILHDKSVEKVIYNLNNNLTINLYKNNYLSYFIFSDQFEKEVIGFINLNLSEGDCFIDVGANIGLFSLLASNAVGRDGLVLSFEPTKDTFIKGQENIHQNDLKNIQYHCCALSDYTGNAQFNVSTDGHDAFNSFLLPLHGNEYRQERVEVKMLDSFYDRIENYKKILLKIDVEGWEYNVIKGAEKILKTLSPVLIIEFNDDNTKSSPYKCKDVYLLLQSYGYDIFSLINGNLILKENEAYFNYQNLIAKRRDI